MVKMTSVGSPQARSTGTSPAATQSTSLTPTPGTSGLCPKCLLEKNENHKCARSHKKIRLAQLQALLSPGSQEQFASNVLRKKCAESNSATVQLKTGGPCKMTVTTGNSAKPFKGIIPLDTMLSVQADGNHSDRKMVKMAGSFKKSNIHVSGDLRRALQRRGRIVAPFFGVKAVEFEVTDPKTQKKVKVEKPIVHCKNVKLFVEFVHRVRRYTGVAQKKIGGDTGDNSLKFTLNLLDPAEDQAPVLMGTPEFDLRDIAATDKTGKNRRLSQEYLSSSVQRLFILSLCSQIPESYNNIEKDIELLGLKDISSDSLWALDLKMQNLMCGLMPHSSKRPCCYCEGVKGSWNEQGQLRTLGRIKECYRQFIEAGGDKSIAKQFMNCEHPPLIAGNDDDLILKLLPPAELHLMLGVTNHLVKKLSEKWPVYKWLEDNLSLKAVEYHGKSFEGPSCNKILQIKNLERMRDALPENLKMFADALMAFSEVKKACFGQNLCPSYGSKIDIFHEKFSVLGISETPKAGFIFGHLARGPHFDNVTNHIYSRS